jgi:hypothetical protein
LVKTDVDGIPAGVRVLRRETVRLRPGAFSAVWGVFVVALKGGRGDCGSAA